MSAPNTRTETEKWLESIGTKLIDVLFVLPNKTMTEAHVADPDMIEVTVRMSLDRFPKPSYAVLPCSKGWALHCSTKPVRHYQTKEAAEMVAIHRG
jgi:hypothetical protein